MFYDFCSPHCIHREAALQKSLFYETNIKSISNSYLYGVEPFFYIKKILIKSSSRNLPFLKGFALSSIGIYSISFEKMTKLYSIEIDYDVY